MTIRGRNFLWLIVANEFEFGLLLPGSHPVRPGDEIVISTILETMSRLEKPVTV